MPPEAVKMLRPYEEALEFQKSRSALTAANFYSLVPDARPRAFTITGLQKYSSLLEANRLAEQAIAEGLTKGEFTELLGKLVDEHGGTLLSPSRLELIYHNAIVTTYAAGSYRQMTDPEFVLDRPIFRYSGPLDDDTSDFCEALNGTMARHDDPIIKRCWPPNHHWERHEWESMTEAQAKERGEIYESPEGQEYPHIGGRTIFPQPGFDFDVSDAMGADDKAFVDAAAELGNLIPRKTAASYGLTSLAEIAEELLPGAPAPGRAITKFTDEEYAQAWERFREALGIAEESTGTWLLDYAKDGVRVNRQTFDHLLALDRDDEDERKEHADRSRWFGFLRPTLEDPAEVWFVPVMRDGKTTFIKRYIGVYRTGEKKQRAFQVMLDRSPEGWLMRTGHAQKKQTLEEQRRGLLVFTKAGRKG